MNIRPAIVEEIDQIVMMGGEMPEVALYDSLHQLDVDGLSPTPEEMRELEAAALKRFAVIIRRDLDPDNRSQAQFRSPGRARINFRRAADFAGRRNLPFDEIRGDTARLWEAYLRGEASDISPTRHYNTLGLDRDQTLDFCRELGMDPARFKDVLEKVGEVPTLDFPESIKAEKRRSREKNRR